MAAPSPSLDTAARLEVLPAPTIAETLARFLAGLALADIPAGVVERAKYLMLDAIGIAFASRRFEFAERSLAAMRGLGGAGDGAVIGFAERLPFRDAALVNGVLVHGLDFDDTHLGGVVHPSASLVPAVLAVAARAHASGAAALAAYIGGVEAVARLGAVAKGGFHQVGFHPTGLVGAFGCALAAGQLMRLDAAALATAQGIALSTASGSLEFLEDGAWNKRLHPGWAAVAGITAAALAESGFVGARNAYEGRFGLYASHLQQHFAPEDLGLATAALGEEWELLNVAVKPFPACHFTHACADAAIALGRQLEAGNIREIRALVPAEVVKTVCEPVAAKRRPANAYDAQFSIPYVVASALRRGRFTLAELTPAAIADAETLALAERVRSEIDPRSGFPEYYSGELVVTTTDGRLLRQREHENRGCATRPLSAADILAKFHDNMRGAAATARAAEIAEMILTLDAAPDMRRVADALGGA
ncbi:MAG: MmgE/PrpD family protein [Stellaceae bacterium]